MLNINIINPAIILNTEDGSVKYGLLAFMHRDQTGEAEPLAVVPRGRLWHLLSSWILESGTGQPSPTAAPSTSAVCSLATDHTPPQSPTLPARGFLCPNNVRATPAFYVHSVSNYFLAQSFHANLLCITILALSILFKKFFKKGYLLIFSPSNEI